ncbi:hypothetical protein LNJ05_10840 [Tenacibaculum finnmarkense genomovar ulcerans]|uniref:hypothetical protein n=1 Tax=Tenacibaculum finnmarkense TaxID=2781243 RepID=UPI001E5156CA|nr:hypothetical protein [Tenacibaculum finnmarkense]MCD8433258.1 hypothetical protein [Tenacibaculum finnmarkense genomovar ulcerans]MCG8803940.1 hypothetical protein [Tenacibaculum finnmarkense]MCG8826634.1 hypothetical protein [Tenacibaculum finnmarkense]
MKRTHYFVLLFASFLFFNYSEEQAVLDVTESVKKSKSLSTYKGLPVVNRLNVPIIDIKNKDGLLAKREGLKQ